MKKYILPILFMSLFYWSCEEEVEDTTPPTVSIQSPITNQSINEVVTIVVETDDNEGISKVEFYIDDSLYFTDTESPYEYVWNTTQYEDNSEHIVKVVSYDNADNSTTSQPIIYVIDNSMSYPNPVNITSVSYTFTELTAEWEQSSDGDFKEYKVLYSNTENGIKDTLATYTNISITSHTISEFDPTNENWFWVQVADTFELSNIGTGMKNVKFSSINNGEELEYNGGILLKFSGEELNNDKWNASEIEDLGNSIYLITESDLIKLNDNPQTVIYDANTNSVLLIFITNELYPDGTGEGFIPFQGENILKIDNYQFDFTYNPADYPDEIRAIPNPYVQEAFDGDTTNYYYENENLIRWYRLPPYAIIDIYNEENDTFVKRLMTNSESQNLWWDGCDELNDLVSPGFYYFQIGTDTTVSGNLIDTKTGYLAFVGSSD